MNVLLDSIKEIGILVPVTVYQGDKGYTLIDGERRWRCAKRLNLPTIPAIIQPTPSPLENLLTMFNIHNVRVQWDLMPTALKLAEIRSMLEKAGKRADSRSLSGVTGVSLPTIRRALDLLDLPKKYQDMLLKEAAKPKAQQKITPDLFLEIYKSMRAIERHAPEVFQEVSKRKYVDTMVEKYTGGVVENVVEFRDLSRMARAELAGVRSDEVQPVIKRLVQTKNYSIKDAYKDTVQSAYEQRDLITRADGLTQRLSRLSTGKSLNKDLRGSLQRLRGAIDRLLG